MSKLQLGSLGILVTESNGSLPFTEGQLCRRLCLLGHKQQIQVFVFCPEWFKPGEQSIKGYSYGEQGWRKSIFPLPDVVYDRYFSRNAKQHQSKVMCLTQLKEAHEFMYLTRGLAGKWIVHQALLQNKELTPYLPETLLFEGKNQLGDWLTIHQGEAFLKPQCGTHGKRTLYIKAIGHKDQLFIRGRSGANTVFTRYLNTSAGYSWIERFTQHKNYLLQPYLHLTNIQEEPFDIRVLMQKEQTGTWNLTGAAARIGRKNSLTSNLHGGGKAHKARSYLIHEFGKVKATEIMDTITHLSTIIPFTLEANFGRLAELGIDYGVDKQGKVWVLEVNSKPGRTAFFQIGEADSARKSVENLIDYTHYLLTHRMFRRINS